MALRYPSQGVALRTSASALRPLEQSEMEVVGSAAMDLANWLRTLGLERFEGTFRENAIDETVLSDLTEDHLRELGLPLGARIKLLKAIKALSRETAIDASAEMAIS